MPWQFDLEYRAFFYYDDSPDDSNSNQRVSNPYMAVEVDKGVTMPDFGNAENKRDPPTTDAAEPKSDIDKQYPQKAPFTDADLPRYATIPDVIRDQVANRLGIGHMLYLVPTEKGMSTFGWGKQLLSFKLMSNDEAQAMRDKVDIFKDFPHAIDFVRLAIHTVTRNEMGGFNYSFDANQYAPEQFGGAHPQGRFAMRITDTDVAPNKNGSGGNFMVEFTSDSGSIKKFYSLWHENPEVARKAHAQLSALSHATGVIRINMNDGGKALINATCMVDIGPQANNPDYNEIKKVYDMQGNLPGKGNASQGQGQQQGQQQGQGFQGQQQGQGQGGGFQGGGFGGQPQGQGQGFGGGAPQGQGGGGFQGQGQGQGQGGPGQGQGGFGGQPQGGGFGGQGQGQGPQGGGFGGGGGGGFGQGQGGPDQGQGGGFQGQGNGQGFQGQGQAQGQGQGQGFQGQGGGFGGGGNSGDWSQNSGNNGGGNDGPGWAQ